MMNAMSFVLSGAAPHAVALLLAFAPAGKGDLPSAPRFESVRCIHRAGVDASKCALMEHCLRAFSACKADPAADAGACSWHKQHCG